MTEHMPTTAAAPSAGLAPANLSKEGQALLLLAFVLVQSGKHTQAMNVLEGLRHWETQSTACLPLLTQCYLELGLFAEALPLAQEMAREQAERGARHMAAGQQDGHALCAARMAAQALWGLNRKEEARAVLDKAIQHGALQSEAIQSGAVQPIAVEEAHALANA